LSIQFNRILTKRVVATQPKQHHFKYGRSLGLLFRVKIIGWAKELRNWEIKQQNFKHKDIGAESREFGVKQLDFADYWTVRLGNPES
jgi:hypothetical protein